MAAKWIEEKRRYRQYEARVERLPPGYRIAIDALQRYSWYVGNKTDDGLSTMEALADLFEQGAANGTPLREIVGVDPVEFAEALLRNHPEGLRNHPEGYWIDRQRKRLTSTIDRAAREDARNKTR